MGYAIVRLQVNTRRIRMNPLYYKQTFYNYTNNEDYKI